MLTQASFPSMSLHQAMVKFLCQNVVAMTTNFLRVISQARNGTLAPAFLPEILYELNFNDKILND